MIERSDIEWFRFERPDKQRPVLLLGRREAVPALSQIVVVPFVTHGKRGRGVLHGATITLDAPAPPRDGRRVQVVIEAEIEDRELSPEENAGLLREWAKRGPQGPLADDDDFPDGP